MKVKQNLKRNKRILESLLELRRPHRRMQYCQKPTPKMAKWWARRLRKREEKRRERLEKVRAGALMGKKKKLTQRELKQQRRKDILSELSKGIKDRLPHFRMLYRAVNIQGPSNQELRLRKHIKKRHMLAMFRKENNLLCSEVTFLLSPSVDAETHLTVLKISKLTQQKMFWDHVFNDVKALLKLLKTKIAENGTVLENLRVRMNKTYFDRKTKEKYMVTQPAYFGEVEYQMYSPKRIHTRKSIKERYLEDLAEIENLFMALDKKGEEVIHYLRTRELFVSVLNRILNRLNSGKKIVLDFLQDGHNIMNDLTMRFLDLMSMKKLTKDIDEGLAARRRQAENERALVVLETKDLMARHRPSQPSTTYKELRALVRHPTKSREQERVEVRDGYEVLQKTALVMGGMTDVGDISVKEFTALSEEFWIPATGQRTMASSFLMQKLPFPLIETNYYRKKVEDTRKAILEKKKTRKELKAQVKEHKAKLQPILESARMARYEVRNQYLALYKTWKYYSKPLRDLYALLNKKASYNSDKLGIHNRMTEYNKSQCLDTLLDTIPYNVAKLVETERYEGARTLPFNSILRRHDQYRTKWKRYQLIRKLVRPQTENLRKRKLYEIKEHPPLHKSPCPLCCVEERLAKMAVVEELEDHIRSVYEIQCELRDTQEMPDLLALNHPIWECNQPAARSLIQLLILEDRTGAPGKIMDFTKMAQ